MMVFLTLFTLIPIDGLSWPVAFRLDGNLLYLLDHPNHRLLVLDWREGRRVRTVGAAGQGPGELEFPDTLWFEDTNIHLFSRIQKTVSVFDGTGAFVAGHKLPWLNGYPMMRTKGGLLVIGTPAGHGYDAPPIKVVSKGGTVLNAAGSSSAAYLKAKGYLQDFFFAEGPDGTFFFADPFEPLKLQWRRSRDLTLIEVIKVPYADLLVWDGLSRDLPEPYGPNTGWSHDRFHAPAPGLYLSFKGQDFLTLTYIRGTGLKDADYTTLVVALEDGAVVQRYSDRAAYPVGRTHRNTILLFGEDDDGYFLRETAIQDYLEGFPGGR